jgi:hypothetical protein
LQAFFVPLQVGEFVAQGFGLRIVTLPNDFPPFELCYLTHPNALADPAKQRLKSAITEIAGDLTYAARRPAASAEPDPRSTTLLESAYDNNLWSCDRKQRASHERR